MAEDIAPAALYLLQESCYREEAADYADRHSYGDQEEKEREGVYCFTRDRDVGKGVVRPVDEQEVDPDYDEGGDARADEGLEQALEDEGRTHEAVRGADQLHHFYLLASGEDGEPDRVGDKEYAGDQEQDRGPVEAPDHIRGHGVEPVDGLLGIAEIALREPFLL